MLTGSAHQMMSDMTESDLAQQRRVDLKERQEQDLQRELGGGPSPMAVAVAPPLEQFARLRPFDVVTTLVHGMKWTLPVWASTVQGAMEAVLYREAMRGNEVVDVVVLSAEERR